MSDSITEILERLIADAQKLLSLLRSGDALGSTEEELIANIGKWQADLARHIERKSKA